MAEAQARLYEGFFLMSQSGLAGDLSAGLEHVQQLIERRGGEVVSLRKWDERRLAYEIEGQRRGTYLLSLFRAEPAQIASMERDCNLSELVVRVMFTRADHLGETEINEELKAAEGTRDEVKLREAGQAPAETPEEQAEDESEPGPEEEPAASGAESSES